MKKDKHNSTEFPENYSRCYCSEDDNSGCTYPENVSSVDEHNPLEMTQESYKIKTEERFIEKDSVCYCSPKDCDCKIEYKETDY